MSSADYQAGFDDGVRSVLDCADAVAQLAPLKSIARDGDGPSMAKLATAIALVERHRLATLRPFSREEAVTPREAATIAGAHPNTIAAWAEKFAIGRKIAGGRLLISRVALAALLDDDALALHSYLIGMRDGPIRPYLERAGLAATTTSPLPPTA